jgi:hypothetical protein
MQKYDDSDADHVLGRIALLLRVVHKIPLHDAGDLLFTDGNR